MRPLTRAVEALISIIMGASIIIANDPAIPNAARLYFASFNRAIKAISNGCSMAIISQVRARGPQNRNILRYVSLSVISTIDKNPKYSYLSMRTASKSKAGNRNGAVHPVRERPSLICFYHSFKLTLSGFDRNRTRSPYLVLMQAPGLIIRNHNDKL